MFGVLILGGFYMRSLFAVMFGLGVFVFVTVHAQGLNHPEQEVIASIVAANSK